MKFLACLLKEAGQAVAIYSPTATLPSLRPWRLRPVYRDYVRDFFLRQGRELPSLEKSFGDYWLDVEELRAGLDDLLREWGVREHIVDALPFPETAPETRNFLDISGRALAHWPRQNFLDLNGVQAYQTLEMRLDRGRHLFPAKPFRPHVIEGALALLEPIGAEALCLSLFSRSRYALERAQTALLQARTPALPAVWKTLLALNGGARQCTGTVEVGPSTLYVPQAFHLGESVGLLPPIGNFKGNYVLGQLRRLGSVLRGPSPQPEHWNRREVLDFQRQYAQAQAFERLLRSPQGRGFLLKMSEWVPLAWRRALKSPL